MHRYIIKRLLLMIPSLLIVSFIVFALARMIPGDIVDMMYEDQGYAKDLDEMRRKLGIDRPIPIQYVAWLGQVCRGDLGVSLWTKQPVLDEMLARLPIRRSSIWYGAWRRRLAASILKTSRHPAASRWRIGSRTWGSRSFTTTSTGPLS